MTPASPRRMRQLTQPPVKMHRIRISSTSKIHMEFTFKRRVPSKFELFQDFPITSGFHPRERAKLHKMTMATRVQDDTYIKRCHSSGCVAFAQLQLHADVAVRVIAPRSNSRNISQNSNKTHHVTAKHSTTTITSVSSALMFGYGDKILQELRSKLWTERRRHTRLSVELHFG
jgi:hypothetical protein